MARLSRAEAVRLIVILGSLVAFAPLSIDMYLPAFPALQAEFGASAGAVQRTLAVFFVGLAAGQIVYGPLADRHGRRPPLIAGVALYAVASIAAACAPNLASLTVARLVQALGGCAGIVIVRAIVADLFEEREAAKVYSLLMLVMGLAPILAPLAGAELLAVFGWASIFWALGVFGLLCWAAVVFGLDESLPKTRRSAGGAGAALRAYGRLLAHRQFVAFAAAFGFVMAGMFAYIAGSPFVFIDLFGLSPRSYGLLFGSNAFGLILASQLNIRLLRRFSGQAIMTAGIAANVVASAALVVVAFAGIGGLAGLVIPLFFAIASLGFVFGNATAAAMAQARTNRGAASALIGAGQFGLGALAGILLGAIQDGSARPMALVIAGCSLAGLAAARIGRRG